MFWTKDERQKLWDKNQIKFAEMANEYPCCYVPTLANCMSCERPEAEKCKNMTELKTAFGKVGHVLASAVISAGLSIIEDNLCRLQHYLNQEEQQ